ncbi:MAG: DAK2 domain-containing protein [Oscillospiraceae bacterium]|nr:DAK2 domain-containing protein [Oscillospiraceae bacterium]
MDEQSVTLLTGKVFKAAFLSGANKLSANKARIDELNVFPVPDGDTGTNMTMTARAAANELAAANDGDISIVAEKIAGAMLRGARGNSGVILSLLFRGLSKGFVGKREVDSNTLSEAFKLGVDTAYKSVMKPTEGTLLTVAREAQAALADYLIEQAEKGIPTNIKSDFAYYLAAAKKSLEGTPELLPILKKAGVVDAGGAGYVEVLEGINAVIQGGEGYSLASSAEVKKISAAGATETDIEFTYCTEFIVIKADSSQDSLRLRAHLESIGDSAVVVDDGEIIKIHVHTEHPGDALEEGLKYGSLINLKIENMREQHRVAALANSEGHGDTPRAKLPFAKPENKYGIVSVVSGKGLDTLFRDLGCDCIVDGGQTNNPSSEDILEAILAVPAQTVYVLPNNKNIIMAAEQAGGLVTDRNVTVLQSRNVPQGIAAMLAFNADESGAENAAEMTAALDRVSSGNVTYAARDNDFDERKIKKGDILGFSEGKLVAVEDDIKSALIKTVKKTITRDTSFLTLIYGANVSDDSAKNAVDAVRAKFGNSIEISLVNGGQPVYYYIISAE